MTASRTTLILLLASLVSWCSPQNQDITCRDEDGNTVDWFMVYKLPRLENVNDLLIKEGLAHVTLTSRSLNSEWKLSPYSINDSQSAPGRTLDPIYNQTDDFLWLLYNDQAPDQPVSYSHGHTKGVVMSGVEGAGGVWLIHSVPHFPPSPNNPSSKTYSYPKTGERYGQTFLCITLPANQMDIVGIQLMYNHPLVYGSCLPSSLEQTLPHLTGVARGLYVRKAPFFRQSTIRSAKNQTFISFAKASEFGKDLYADWVSSALEANLLVESWPNGPGRLPSSCQRNYRVENVLGVNISAAGVQFQDSHDHSKWAVQKDSSHWICIGDINRMTSQEERAGGTVCLNKAAPWKVFREAVINSEHCQQHSNSLEV